MTCDECGARGPGLSPVIVGGKRKTLCATCNPYSPVRAVATDRLRATDGGSDVRERDIEVEDKVVDELVDLLTIKTRRSGRGSWSFSVADLTPRSPQTHRLAAELAFALDLDGDQEYFY